MIQLMQRKSNNARSIMKIEGTPKFLPKIKLMLFNGKELRAWLRKCIKYFEIRGIAREQMVNIVRLFLIEKTDAWFHIGCKEKGIILG